MRTPQCLCVAILLLLLKYNEVLAYTLSVASDQVAVGQTFVLSWTSASNDLQDVDICLNTNTEFLRIGSIQRSNHLEGEVDVTVNKTITPGTYTLGIRFPGCAFLFAQDFNDFVVTAPAPATSTSTTPQSTRSQTTSASSPPHTSSRTSSTSAASATPTSSSTFHATPTSSSTFQANSAAGVHTGLDSGPGSGINTGSAASVIPTAQSQTTSVETPTVTSPDSSTTPSSGALGITESIWGKGMMVQFVGYMFGVLMVFL